MMKSEDGLQRDNRILAMTNPNQMCYGICFISNDYIEVVMLTM